MSSLARFVLLSFVTITLAPAWGKELPETLDGHVDGYLFDHAENSEQEIAIYDEPAPATLHFKNEGKIYVDLETTWIGQNATHYRSRTVSAPKHPFVAYAARTPLKLPYGLVDAGDGTWQFAENKGIWLTVGATGGRMYQGFLVSEIVEPDRPPLTPVTLLKRREIALWQIESQVGTIPEHLGLLPLHAAEQTYFVGTEGRTPLSVIVIGYETFDAATSNLSKRTQEARGFAQGAQLAWIVPRAHLSNDVKTLFPIYRVPVSVLQFAGQEDSAKLVSHRNQFSEAKAEQWLQTYFERNQKIEIAILSSVTERMDFRASAIRSSIQETYAVPLSQEILSPAGIPLSCSRVIITLPKPYEGAD